MVEYPAGIGVSLRFSGGSKTLVSSRIATYFRMFTPLTCISFFNNRIGEVREAGFRVHLDLWKGIGSHGSSTYVDPKSRCDSRETV